MKRELTKCYAGCAIIIDSDSNYYHFKLTVLAKEKYDENTTEFKIPRRCTDANKSQIIQSMKDWYIKNKKSKYCDPEYFMNCINEDLKNAVRIRNWKTIKELEEDKQKYIDAIDPYTQYIDSYKQQEEAKRHNERLRETIQLYNKVINEMKELEKDHSDIQYSFGLFRYKNSDKYEFIKFSRF